MALPVNWTINDVSQQQYDDYLDIYFSINEIAYLLRVGEAKVNAVFEPWYIVHQSNELCVKCQLKAKHNIVCDDLSSQVRELFYELIQFPSIRLEWLYLSYKEKQT